MSWFGMARSGSRWAVRPGRHGALVGALVLGCAVLNVANGPAARADNHCNTVVVSGGTVFTCDYDGAGTYAFTVPPGVTSVDVVAAGAEGGGTNTAPFNASGGRGASVEDTAVPVGAYQGQALTVVIGGEGGYGEPPGDGGAGGAGGSPGGGGAGGGDGVNGVGGGGGGGYSGLFDESGGTGTALVLAAGGGGAADAGLPGGYTGGTGDIGAGGGAGQANTNCTVAVYEAACGGGGATGTAGGAGGSGSPGDPGYNVNPGGPGGGGTGLAGGAGGNSLIPDDFNTVGGGGGGGGGYYGGGGGGNGEVGGGGAGGGGSSYGITGLTNERPADVAASVTITYEVTAPQAPADVSAVAGDTQISASWSAPADNGNSTITGYRVSAQAGTSTITETLDDPSATSAVIGGLTNGTAYDVTVAAINAVGTSPTAVPASSPLTPTAAAPLITTSDSLAVGVGQNLDFKLSSLGAPKPAVTASGLPGWVTFTPATAGGSATLSGKPPAGAGGVYPVTFGASNGVGFAVTQSATLSVLEFTSAPSATFALGQSDSFTVTTSLPSPAATMALTGGLPPDVSYTVTDGTAVLSGIPAGAAKAYTITFTATFGAAKTTQKFTLTTTG